MSRPVIPQRKRKRGARPRPKHRIDGTFKVSKRGKYNAQGVRIDGIWFASAAEGDRYCQLKRLAETGAIQSIECQPSYSMSVNGVPVFVYRGDFRYRLVTDGRVKGFIIEDVKGYATPDYKLKKKIIEAQYSIIIHELPASYMKEYEGLAGPEAVALATVKKKEAAARKKERVRAKKKLAEEAEAQEESRSGVDAVQ